MALELLNPQDTLLEATIRELQRELVPNRAMEAKQEGSTETIERIQLADFVESTSGLILEPWQKHMCKRLQMLTYQKGQRILLHKPPQHGGSVIVSQRLPAYLIGDNPYKRVRLACYNIEHATKFTAINKAIMQSPEYRTIFKDSDLIVPAKSSDAEFSTAGRKKLRDAQSSLMALGLATGFVGQGADDLIIDDPYASPQAAASPAIRASTWTFWTGSARVRIDENTNVIVMFHRYGEEDFAGQLIEEEGLKQEGGKWELISYRAEWDGDERLEVGGKDPVDRKVGQYLSPRKASQPEYYKEQKRNIKVWESQFQGKPSTADGSTFLVRKFDIVPKVPVPLQKVCFAWDLASSIDGDWTVGVLMGLGIDDVVYVLDVARFRLNTNERNTQIRINCVAAYRRYPDIIIRMPQDPASAGKDVVAMLRKLLKGLNVKFELVSGDKEKRADPWSQYVNAGLVKLVYSGDIREKDSNGDFRCWIPTYIDEHQKFPNSVKKDQIDASSDAFSEIALAVDIPIGEDFDTVGIGGARDEPSLVIDIDDEQNMLTDIMLLGLGEMDAAYQKFVTEGFNPNDSFYKENEAASSFKNNLKLATNSERKANLKARTKRSNKSSQSNIYRS